MRSTYEKWRHRLTVTQTVAGAEIKPRLLQRVELLVDRSYDVVEL
jgi:hypothetical protein